MSALLFHALGWQGNEHLFYAERIAQGAELFVDGAGERWVGGGGERQTTGRDVEERKG